jgi:hypothetical protein
VLINGSYDFNDAHNIRADVNAVDIGLINVFYPGLSFLVGGKIDGAFVLKGNNHKHYLNTFLQVADFSLDKDTLGDFSLTSNFNEKLQRFLIYAKSVNGKLRNFEAGGFVSTADDAQINIDVTMDESNTSVFQALVKDFVYIRQGVIQGKCKITGTMDKPQLDGEIDLARMDVLVEYLKTRYKFNAHISFDNDHITLTPFSFTDDAGKTGNVSGGIVHKGFSDLDFDIHVSGMKHVHMLNTTAKDNSVFYGTAFGSGSVSLTGTADDLLLETDLTTEKGTAIFIPLAGSSESGDAGFINFLNRDTVFRLVTEKKNVFAGFEVSSVIHATSDAEFQLILNEQTGDIIKGTGSGTVKLELTRQGSFNMYGQVIIDQGEYRFTAAKVFTKKFNLTKGGTIAWTGDPMLAHMNIQGVYYVRRASIIELVPSAATANPLDSKIPVECLLYVKGNFLAPEIKFDLNFPDLQTTIGTNNVSEIQNVVRSLRADPDLMNQQVMSLMLFGKFVQMSGYNANSGTNLQTGAASSLSDIFTAQANNLIGNFIPGLDFNIDYQMAPDINKSRTIFSASKKFYDNRFEVVTSYDPVAAAAASSAANIANVTTQYNISKDGNLKIKAFNRNTTDPIYNRNALIQGVGLYYRKEFDSFFEKKKATQ